MRPEPSRLLPAERTSGILRATVDAVLSFLFPDGCVACGAPLEASRRHVCLACESGLRASGGSIALPGIIDAARSGAADASAFYALEFGGAARALVHALKYGGRTSLAVLLAAIAAPEAIRACAGPPDVVTPVPLHPLRLRERGFNQSELLAAGLAEAMNVPARRTLRRVRYTAPQARLPRHRRLEMPPSAFRATVDAAGLDRVLLVDDVVTTGATLAAASLALMNAGAGEVVCFALAGTQQRAPSEPLSPKAVDCAGSGH